MGRSVMNTTQTIINRKNHWDSLDEINLNKINTEKK